MGIFKFVARAVVFPCIDAISWILKHIDLENRHICNTIGDPIASFQPKDLVKYHHIGKGMKKLDSNLLVDFKNTTKELCTKW
jgi:hypothetical protein